MPSVAFSNGHLESACVRKGQVSDCSPGSEHTLPFDRVRGERSGRGRKADGWDCADQELINHLLQGDPGAAMRFVSRFERLVHRQLHDLGVPFQDHEDLFQEVFLSLWDHNCHRLRMWKGHGHGLFSSYLRVLIRNLIHDIRRKRIIGIPWPQPFPAPDQDAQDPTALLLCKEQKTAIIQALDDLPARDRELIARRLLREESYQEIALAMGLTANHVGVLIPRALLRLKKKLYARYPGLFSVL